MIEKSFYRKTLDFFTTMGKKVRPLLPLAVIGLAITMLIANIGYYFKRSKVKLSFLLFILCCFLLGNSFAFPNLYSEGFIDTEVTDETYAASLSKATFADDDGTNIDDGLISNGAVFSEGAEDLTDSEDLIYLDDILDNVDEESILSASGSEEEFSFSQDDWRIILINKQHPIPDDYEFTLGTLSGSMQCDERIISDLLLMMKEAKEDGVSLIVCSPYRNLDRQEMLFERKINNFIAKGYSYMDAYKLASQEVTVPGSSEHQVGLSIDFLTDGYTTLDEGFKDTAAGIWLKENGADYGFILRYPDDKEYITSIEFEPWHYRYVGREAAKIIMDEGICLEEFWEKYL